MSNKECFTCHELKIIETFNRNVVYPDGRHYECRECAKTRKNRCYANNKPILLPKKCGICDAEFTPKFSYSKYCSVECRKLADQESDRRYRERHRTALKEQKQEWNRRNPENLWNQYNIRRQRKNGSNISRQAVYERDGWKCQLCFSEIDPTISWPDPFSASVDHIIPLASGGKHVLDNVQASHLRCNQIKGVQPPKVPSAKD